MSELLEITFHTSVDYSLCQRRKSEKIHNLSASLRLPLGYVHYLSVDWSQIVLCATCIPHDFCAITGIATMAGIPLPMNVFQC